MALASLFQQVKTVDGPEFDLTALIVDHGHRADSQQEALNVSDWLGDLGQVSPKASTLHD